MLPVRRDAATPRAPMGLPDMRRHHLSVVLEHLACGGPRSKAALAHDIGLTKATMSAVVSDLLERALVEERSPVGGRIGRPAVDIAVSDSVVGLGLQIDADGVAACVLDLTGAVKSRHRRDGDHRQAEPAEVLDRLREVAAEADADIHAAGAWCAGAGLAVPGLVDPGTGALFVAPNLHWLDVDLTAPQAVLGLPASFPVTVDNEANLAALAELRHGIGRDRSSFVYVSGGVGIGAGVVIDGSVVRGAHGFAGELGHVRIEPSGSKCACGARGCLETVAGTGRRTSQARRADALAAALRNVVHLVDPEAIVLGGGFSAGGDQFAAAVADRLHASTLGARWRPCPVQPSSLGPDAALIGAATAALDAVIADPTIVPVDPLTLTA